MKRILIVFIFSYSLLGNTFGQMDRFYTKKDGLAGTFFHALMQDSKGYLWICTMSGLNRFDGYNFEEFHFDISDSTTLNSTIATSVFEDRTGKIWVGTNTGLNLYNPLKNSFRRILLMGNAGPLVLIVKSIFQDSADNLYLVTSHGLIRMNTLTGKQELFNLNFEANGAPSFTQFNAGVIDPNGNIWIATTHNGVVVFETSRNRFLTLGEYTHTSFQLPKNNYLVISITPKDEIIIGTQKGDIYVYDYKRNEISPIVFKNSSQKQLLGGIASIVTDKNETTWIGTEYSGLKILDVPGKKIVDANAMLNIENIEKSRVACFVDLKGDLWFAINYLGLYHKINPVHPFQSITTANSKLNHHLVKSILRDKNGNLWLGSDGGGLTILPATSFSNKTKGQVISNVPDLSGNAVMCFHEDRRGWIWIGTYLDGLYCYRGLAKGFKHYPVAVSGTDSPLYGIFDIEEDSAGNLWIGTNGSELFYFDVVREKATHIGQVAVQQGNAQLPKDINKVILDSDGTIWMATYYGFCSWNSRLKTYIHYSTVFRDMYNDAIYDMESGPNNTLLLSSFSGFLVFDKVKKTIVKYTKQQGLASNSVMSVKVDGDGVIWLSTSNGISKFNFQNQTFKNYFVYDGLPCNEFLANSNFLDKEGNLYFGGVNGLVYFNPKSIVNQKERPQLIFTNFNILNQPIKNGYLPNGRKILDNLINETDTIHLKHSDKSFTLEYAAIEFSAPEKIKYAVWMEGFDKTWTIKDYKQRYASYTNLNSGTYFLYLKSTNADGDWIEPARRICIIIAPPFWLTWWAYVIYLLVLAGIFYYVRSVVVFRIKIIHRLHLEEMERRKQESISQEKLQFFTNISHEIRTPLTMLLAPLHQLIQSGLNEVQLKYASYIQRNTKRLERLVNQLLELQKIENQQLELHSREIDIVNFVREILYLFEGAAKEQKVEISFEPCSETLRVWFDPDKMDKVFFNLLSNALKFTPAGGLITVAVNCFSEKINEPENWCEIKVIDTGKGIKQEYLEKIFDRFYQIENKEPVIQVGTGIGLHIARNLVLIHKGKIKAESISGQGTTFTVEIPIGAGNFSAKAAKGMEESMEAYKHNEMLDVNAIKNEDFAVPEKVSGSDKPTVLLVEDDIEILNFLEAELNVKYEVLKAVDGDIGWKMAFEHTPNLIISDITMPGMNGIELCTRVKATIETSHIPVILLTARVAVEHELEGLETGADDYIHKPFNPSILQLKVDKIIELRETLKRKFSKGVSFTAKEMTITSNDEVFLQKAINYVKNNLSEPEFSIDKMCSDIGISRVHLYRKIKALTNQVPSEFIRIIRLKQAAYLLAQNKINISEVAYKVGFNSHQYFTNSFQNYFNMSPKEYAALKQSKQEAKDEDA